MNKDDKQKQLLLNRLASWENELETNDNRLAHAAPKAIDGLKKIIRQRWPDELKTND